MSTKQTAVDDLRWRLRTDADVMQQRAKSLDALKRYYLENLAEDTVAGSTFDTVILNVIQGLKDKYCPLKRPRNFG